MIHKLKNIALLMLIMLLAVTQCGCSIGYKRYTKTFVDYFDTAATVIGYEKSESSFNEKCSKIEDMLEFYHKQYDIYHTYDGLNNICTVNKNAGIASVKVDSSIINLLEFSKEMYVLTDGTMNVAMGSVLSIWHKYRQNGTNDPESAVLPPLEELKAAAQHCDINSVVIDNAASTVYISDPLELLDVGAVAKGYTTEIIADMLHDDGVTGYALNIGGNVRTLGKKPDGSCWSAGVQNPDTASENQYLISVNVSDRSLVTSGSYQRYYTVGGKRYHHIIDPITLMPENRFLSVSVIAADSGQADALSTALFNSTLEDGKILLKKSGAEAIWVTFDNELRYSDGAKEYFDEK